MWLNQTQIVGEYLQEGVIRRCKLRFAVWPDPEQDASPSTIEVCSLGSIQLTAIVTHQSSHLYYRRQYSAQTAV